jgi:predicted esterase
VHRFFPATAQGDPTTLLILHGMGGDENSLVPLGRAVAPGTAILSPRGKVQERGLRRFFRRSEGQGAEGDLGARALELADFVEEASREHGIDSRNLFGVGFSNGANVAVTLLLLRPRLLRGAVLFRPTEFVGPEAAPDLSGVPVFVSAGLDDPLVPSGSIERLVGSLEGAGAEVELRWRRARHELVLTEVRDARKWLSSLTPPVGRREAARKGGAG